MAAGWTTARADQGPPRMGARVESCCNPAVDAGQRRHSVAVRKAVSGMSSPVSTQERVSGSLRSSIIFGQPGGEIIACGVRGWWLVVGGWWHLHLRRLGFFETTLAAA